CARLREGRCVAPPVRSRRNGIRRATANLAGGSDGRAVAWSATHEAEERVMSESDHDNSGSRGPEDFEELQRILREMLQGGGAGANGMDAEQFAKAAGIPVDPKTLQGLFSTLQGAMQHPSDEIDWSTARRTAIEAASG